MGVPSSTRFQFSRCTRTRIVVLSANSVRESNLNSPSPVRLVSRTSIWISPASSLTAPFFRSASTGRRWRRLCVCRTLVSRRLFLPPKVSETRSGCPVGVSGFLVSSSLCFVDSSSLRSLPFSKHHSLLFLLLLLLRHHRSPRFARSSSSSGRGISAASARFPAGRPIPVSESAPRIVSSTSPEPGTRRRTVSTGTAPPRTTTTTTTPASLFFFFFFFFRRRRRRHTKGERERERERE